MKINGKNYSLLLVDTNILSELLKNPDEWFYRLNEKFKRTPTILTYSIFSLVELYQQDYLFEKYINLFSNSINPSLILDGYDRLFEKEIESYFYNDIINPVTITPFAINHPKFSNSEKLSIVLKNSGFYNKAQNWINMKEEILHLILKLKKNYPPKNKTYTKKEIELFIFIVTTQQIGIKNMKFAKKILVDNQSIDINKFAAIKSYIYTVFYKFYLDDRKPKNSDLIDINICATLPYVDYFVTEGNLCNIIKTIQKRHNFLNNVKTYSIKELK